MLTTQGVLSAAERYMGARGIAGTTLCRLAVGNSTVWERLPSGHVTIRTAARLLQWLSDHWPPHLEWPPDVPRPEPQPAPAREEEKEAA
ncbi:MAG: hypothetical protein F4Y47_00255 [Acidobacteriia bacterium]|nr:hypothetical protein [Terriglobia bacterium]MYK11270.1 hypothetical protein [Terriglobia bacterium]